MPLLICDTSVDTCVSIGLLVVSNYKQQPNCEVRSSLHPSTSETFHLRRVRCRWGPWPWLWLPGDARPAGWWSQPLRSLLPSPLSVSLLPALDEAFPDGFRALTN